MEPQERRNALYYALGEGIWGLGVGLVAPLTVLPLLIAALGGGAIEIGLMYSIVTAGFLITQPVGTLLWQHGGGKRSFLLTYWTLTTVPVFLAGAAVMWLLAGNPDSRGLARALIMALFALRVFLTGAALPLWQDWVYGLFSVRSRGRAAGLWAAASALGISVAAAAAAKISQAFSFPLGYALLFAGAAVFFGASMGAFGSVSAGQPRPSESRPTLRELLGWFRHSLREVNYTHFLFARVLLAFGAGAMTFVAVHFSSAEGGGLSGATVIALGAFLTLAQAAACLWLGFVGDRAGHRIGVLCGAMAQLAGLAIAFFGQGPLACTLSFVCLGVACGAAIVSHNQMNYETCPHENRVVHITLSNLVLGPFVAAVPVGAGYLVMHIGRANTFAVSLVPTVLAILWLLVRVRDPRDAAKAA